MRSAKLLSVVGLFAFCLVAPASASAVTVSGTVTCKAGDVVGVWVDRSGGGGGFAKWSPLPGNAKVASFSRSVSAGTIKLHVGCGGSKKTWGSEQWTATTKVTKNRVLNAFCTGKLGVKRKVVCSWPARSTAAGAFRGESGQCTAWAASKWRTTTGKYPNWGGNANQWDEKAKALKWSVTGAPALRSVVVWEAGTTGGFNYGGFGHVAWVEAIDYRKDGWYIRVSEQNLPRGRGPRSDRIIKHVSGMKYIHAPN